MASAHLRDLRVQHLLPLERVEWLSKDERACLFFFLLMAPKLNISLLRKGLSAAHEESEYVTPQDHKARYDLLLTRIDDSSDINGKAHNLSLLERDYVDAQKRVKPLPWLKPGNDDACQWAWDYLLKFHESKIELINKAEAQEAPLGDDVAPIPLLFWLEPHNELEQVMAFYAALQTWKCSPSELTLFRTNISKAWRQRQLRRSDDVRAVNSHIRRESKERLDALPRHYGFSLQKTLEKIIEMAYLDIRRK
ncbi:MAG: hypothetical protein ACTJHW_10300 [Paenalcaligenes sp.]